MSRTRATPAVRRRTAAARARRRPLHGRAPQATVVGDSDPPRHLLRLAEQVGTLLARLGVTVVSGGRGGVMEAASRGARQAGGLTVAILPSADLDAANRWCAVVVPTGLGHARNALTALAGDFLVAVGGGAGTLSELALAWIHARPILLLAGSGGWADALAGRDLDGRRSSTLTTCADIRALETEIRALCAARGLTLRDS